MDGDRRLKKGFLGLIQNSAGKNCDFETCKRKVTPNCVMIKQGKSQMAETNIEWTDYTFNPWIGCQKVSPGCDHCYAEAQNNFRKWNGGEWGPHAPRKRTAEATWKNPVVWAQKAEEQGRSLRVFCASLADVFDNRANSDDRRDLFKLVRRTPALDYLLLTKRPENIERMLPADWGDGYANVWLGTTAEDQLHYDRRWKILRRIPAIIYFISYEPALGPLSIDSVSGRYPDWIICGGESGGGARYMKPEWARALRDECDRLDVAFFMKQMTKKTDIPADLLIRHFPKKRRHV
jgi:protein gp37